jgi:hypothetical protein
VEKVECDARIEAKLAAMTEAEKEQLKVNANIKRRQRLVQRRKQVIDHVSFIVTNRGVNLY